MAGTARSDVDRDIQTFLRQVQTDYAHFGQDMVDDPVTRRAVAERVRARWSAGGPMMAVSEDLQKGKTGVRLRIHRPTSDACLPVLVYLHGGGWTVFSLDTHDRLMREYAARAGVAVIGVDYCLAPEAKFPRALDEIVDVIEWLRAAPQGAALM